MLLFPSALPPSGSSYAPAFTPASLNPTAWWDFSDLSNMFQDTAGSTPVTASGQSIARVNDKSGNGFNLLQGTSGNRPIYTTGSGLSWAAFTGSNSQVLATPGNPGIGLKTLGIYVAFGCTSSSNSNNGIVSLGSASGADWNSSDGLVMQITGGGQGVEFYGNNHAIVPIYNTSVPNPAVAEATMTNGTVSGSGAGNLIVNGSSVSSNSGQSYGFASANGGHVAVGGRVSTGPSTYGGYFTGKAFQILVFTTTLSPSNVSALRTWLGSKCGLSL